MTPKQLNAFSIKSHQFWS